MRCFKFRCPWNEDGQCTMTEYDELPDGDECPKLIRNDVVGNDRMLYGDDD